MERTINADVEVYVKNIRSISPDTAAIAIINDIPVRVLQDAYEIGGHVFYNQGCILKNIKDERRQVFIVTCFEFKGGILTAMYLEECPTEEEMYEGLKSLNNAMAVEIGITETLTTH